MAGGRGAASGKWISGWCDMDDWLWITQSSLVDRCYFIHTQEFLVQVLLLSMSHRLPTP
jgi:hypothetical protein